MNGSSQLNVFDGLAESYDDAFTARAPAQWLRAKTFRHVSKVLKEPAKILEVGCGTGEDAIRFAKDGHTVIATDVSNAMLEVTTLKVDSLLPDVSDKVRVHFFDAAAPKQSGLIGGRDLDLMFSNFGALNCVNNLDPLMQYANERLKPGGHMAISLMGRFCLWESLGFTLKGDFRRATRRWSGSSEFKVGDVTQAIRYPTVGAVKHCLPENLSVVDILGIGVFIPPSEFYSLCERWPRLFRGLARIENGVSAWWPFNRIGDHFLMMIQKKGESV